MLIAKTSPFSGKLNAREIDCTQEEFDKFNDPNNFDLIQKIFPNLSADDREFLKTGITPEEWI